MKTINIIFLTFIFSLFSSFVIGQTANATEFLKFSKLNFAAKSSKLQSGNWNLIQPTSSETENEITTKTSFYGTEISSKAYYIILEFMNSSKTTTQIEKTSIKLPSGAEFDKWVAEFENMGYTFQKVSGHTGHLFSGQKGMMIKVGINNIEASSSEWSYEISIMIDNK